MGKGHYKIGEISELTELTPDTLRYYERIGLLTNVPRTSGGARRYSEENLACLRFIQRAQKMNFSLAEIGQLVRMREAPAETCQDVHNIAQIKLQEIEAHISELVLLQNELQSLATQCSDSSVEGCAILDGLGEKSKPL